jgi:hypothetical protein
LLACLRYAKVCPMHSYASLVPACLWHAKAADITAYAPSIR